MGLLNSIKKFKFLGIKLFPLKNKKRRSRELNEEEESCDSLSHQETIDDGEEDILDAGELCSDSSSLRDIDEEEDEKYRESDEESEDILDGGLSDSSSDHQEINEDDGKSKENEEEEEDEKSRESDEESEDILDDGLCDSSSIHEITEEKNNALHEIISIEVEGGSSSKGRAQKCLWSRVQKEEISRNRKEEKNKALHVKKREIVSIEEEGEDVLDGEICDSSYHHEKITEDEEKDGNSKDIDGEEEKSRQLMNEEEIAAAGNKALHVKKKREIISIEEKEDGKYKEIDDEEEEVEAKKEEKIREMIYLEIQEKERAILELDRALAHAKRKLKTMAEKPRRGECVSSSVFRAHDTSIFEEEKAKKSKKRVKFIVEEKEKAEGICISNEDKKRERFDGQRVEKLRRGECVSYKGAGPSCVFGAHDTSVFQEEKPKKYEKRVKFTLEEKGKVEGIHVSNEEEKIERFAGQEEPKMRRISNEEEYEKLEGFVTTNKKGHHNGVCNEEEKIKGRLDEIRPQKKSVSSNEEENNNKKVGCDEGRKVQGFDERQAKEGNFDDDDDDVAEFIGGIMQGRNSCDYHYNNTWDNKPYEEENVHHNKEENVHHNKNLFKYLFSFGIGLLLMILRVYCIMVSREYILEI